LVWDLRTATPPTQGGRAGGPLVVPGKYQVRFTAGDVVETQPLEVRLDPRVVADGVTQADLQEQYDLLLAIQETSGEGRRLAIRVAEEAAGLRPQDPERANKLGEIHAQLVTSGGPYPQPMLIDQLGSLSRMVESADMKIGRSAFEYFEELKGRLEMLRKEVER
jgi:hypothetical protein